MKPVFQTNIHNESTNGNCMRASLASIFEISIDDLPRFEEMDKDKWRKAFENWLGTQGYSLSITKEQPITDGYYMMLGKTVRGVLHCVVAKQGNMVHDPHPSGTGLTTITRYWQFIPK